MAKQHKGFLGDGAGYLLGKVRLRQIRVKKGILILLLYIFIFLLINYHSSLFTTLIAQSRWNS